MNIKSPSLKRIDMQRKIWIILVILLFLGMAYGQEVTITPRVTESRISYHSIDVYLENDGSANIQEQFFFNFFAGETEQLEKDFQENTPSLAEWKRDYSFVHPYIGIENRVEGLEFLLKKTVSNQPTLQLSYKYSQLSQKIATENQGRSTIWKLSESTLLNFISAGSIIIDERTQIKIHLPTNSVLDKRPLPNGIADTGNIITLTNFQSNSLNVQYTILTPIADPIDSSKLISNFLESPLAVFLLAIIALIAAYVYINREGLSEKIENYVIEHSEFKTPNKGPEIGDEIE